jgi:hypothetical protein
MGNGNYYKYIVMGKRPPTEALKFDIPPGHSRKRGSAPFPFPGAQHR